MDLTSVITWVITNWIAILNIIAYTCLLASAIVKLTPTLKDDNIVLPIVKFIAKYLALNKSVNSADRPVI